MVMMELWPLDILVNPPLKGFLSSGRSSHSPTRRHEYRKAPRKKSRPVGSGETFSYTTRMGTNARGGLRERLRGSREQGGTRDAGRAARTGSGPVSADGNVISRPRIDRKRNRGGA